MLIVMHRLWNNDNPAHMRDFQTTHAGKLDPHVVASALYSWIAGGRPVIGQYQTRVVQSAHPVAHSYLYLYCKTLGNLMAHTPAHERRKQFIEAASKVISEKGITGATTRAIAKEAGAPLASLHYTFDGKESLLLELLRSSIPFGSEVFGTASGSSAGGVEEAAKTMVLAWRSVERPIIVAQFDIFLWSMRTKAAENEAAALYAKLVDHVAAILEQSALEHEQSFDFRRLATRMIILVDGIQFGTLCAGPDYVSDADIANMVSSLVQDMAKAACRTR